MLLHIVGPKWVSRCTSQYHSSVMYVEFRGIPQLGHHGTARTKDFCTYSEFKFLNVYNHIVVMNLINLGWLPYFLYFFPEKPFGLTYAFCVGAAFFCITVTINFVCIYLVVITLGLKI